MDQLKIIGGQRLTGQVQISGAKNAVLPLMCASLLTDQPLILTRVPQSSDVTSLTHLLEQHGATVQLLDPWTRRIEARTITNTTAPYDIVRKMRASVLVLGPLVARCGEARVSLPGGCAIGSRPIDVHIKGLMALGATITLEEGYVIAQAPHGLTGGDYTFPMVSVGGTENLLMAACLAKGQSRLINAAQEPEITALAECLIAMGAKIDGVGTSTLTIQGVTSLGGTTFEVISDRIEAGTYAIAAAITGGDLELLGGRIDHLSTFIPALRQAGVTVEETPKGFRVRGGEITPVDIMTEPFPGYPTDLQAQFMVLMTQTEGASMITETIFENRFMHVPELTRLGANIITHGASALVRGKTPLKGAPVMATDIRASFSLVLGGLVADGETTIHRLYHLDRGYESVEEKLRGCGAQVERVSELEEEPQELALRLVP
jgi:UDP-N-acetylglucosamine 1-carboxyvinyltransferase